MKKLIFGLIATVLISSFGFGQDTSKFLKAEMYGTYHNELLKIYYEKYSKQENKDFKVMFDNMLLEFERLHPNLVTKEEKEFYSKRVNEILGTNTGFSNLKYNEIFNNTVKKYYSPKIQEFLIDAFNKSESPEIVTSKINILKSDKSLSLTEIEEIKKFESVYNASQIFWQSTFSNSNNIVSKYKCNPHHQTFIADAAGMMFGGWGCLVFSAFVVEAQDQHGGGCI